LTQTITIVVNGDTLDEDDELFNVVLSNPSAQASSTAPASARLVTTMPCRASR